MKPGIYTMTAEEYHADPAESPSLSNGAICTLLDQTPLHAWLAHPRLNPDVKPDDGTKQQDLGQVLHGMLLEGVDRSTVVIADSWRTKKAQEERDLIVTAKRIPLLTHQHDQCVAMIEAAAGFLKQTPFARYFAGGEAKAEQTVIWKDDHHVWCRSRLDLLTDPRHIVFDYKSTGLKSPAEFIRKMPEHGYHTQSAFYRRGLSKLGHPGARFLFLVQETEEPFMCYFVENDEGMDELANSRIRRALALWKQCTESGVWPGYSTDIYQAGPTAWQIRDEEAYR